MSPGTQAAVDDWVNDNRGDALRGFFKLKERGERIAFAEEALCRDPESVQAALLIAFGVGADEQRG